jgi:radical SAM protein with 4Fe4S-binding SPASM domain
MLETHLNRYGLASDRDLLRRSLHFGHDISLAEFRRILAELPLLEEIDIQGVGEPLLNPEALDMIEWASKQGISITFTTNGTMLTTHAAKALVTNKVSQITVSVDGATPATYSFIRRGSTLPVVLFNIKRLAEIRTAAQVATPRIRLAMVLTSNNVSELPDLVNLAKACGADAVTCAVVKPIVSALADWVPGAGVVHEAVVQARDRAAALGVEFECEIALPATSQGEKIATRSLCVWPWLSAMITVDGYVTPCCYVTNPNVYHLGHLRDESFSKIWEGDRYKDFRRRLRDENTASLPCHDCHDHVGLSQYARTEANR